jgi:hypothetical protein
MELIETMQRRVVSTAADDAVRSPFDLNIPAKLRITAAARAKIAAGARARWVRNKGKVTAQAGKRGKARPAVKTKINA